MARFGSSELDSLRQLSCTGEEVHGTPKAFDLSGMPTVTRLGRLSGALPEH